MTLSLHQRLLEESPRAARAVPRGLRLPWRDSATQQLDALEVANRGLATEGGRGGYRLLLLLVATGLLFVAVTSSWQAVPAAGSPVSATVEAAAARPQPSPAAAEPAPTPAAHPAQATLSAPVALAAAPVPEPTAEIATSGTPVAADPALALIEQAAHQRVARARALADARRQDARVAQQRTLADKDRLRASERSQAERGDEPPVVARSAEPAPPVLAPAVAPRVVRANVADQCAGAGFFGQSLCQARECRKPEHAGDAVCVRLRELELARARVEQ